MPDEEEEVPVSFHTITLDKDMSEITPEFLAAFKKDLANALNIPEADIHILGFRETPEKQEGEQNA